MTINELVATAATATGYACARQPYHPAAGTDYITWNEVSGRLDGWRSNAPSRTRHTVNLHLYTTEAPDDTEMARVISVLEANGLRVQYWGPQDYETDTGYHHMPIAVQARLQWPPDDD